jgi:asparagine synthetase B (glutamine-hydrolysing)
MFVRNYGILISGGLDSSALLEGLQRDDDSGTFFRHASYGKMKM